jgi:hypothetical protein
MQFLKISAALAAFTLAMAGVAAAANSVAYGTYITGTLQTTLNSGSANVGDGFSMVATSASSGSSWINGATIQGHVADVQRASQGRNGQIQLAFDRIVYRNGSSAPLYGSVTKMDVQTKSNATKEVVGAVGGMVVGNILGKWIGTNLGGAVGAGGGYALAKNNRQNVTIPSGSTMTMEVQAPPIRYQQRSY